MVLYPYIYYIIVKVYNTLSVPLSDNERTSNKNASISTKSIFKSVHETLFHKLKPFIGSCYNLHTRYGNSKLKKTPEKSSRQSGRPQVIHIIFVFFDEKRQFPAVTCYTMFPHHYPTFNPTTLFHLTFIFLHIKSIS